MEKFDFKLYRKPFGGEDIGQYALKEHEHMEKEYTRFFEYMQNEFEKALKYKGLND